jgi:hypothetical protein
LPLHLPLLVPRQTTLTPQGITYPHPQKHQQIHVSSPKTSKLLTIQQHTVGILVRSNVLFLKQYRKEKVRRQPDFSFKPKFHTGSTNLGLLF